MRSSIWIGLAIILAAPGTTPAATIARMSQRYVGASTQDTYPVCRSSGPSYGGACFIPPQNARTIAVALRDDSGRTIAGSIEFVVDPYGPVIREPAFCGSVSGVAVPAGTQGVTIRTLAAESLLCPGGRYPTQGKITAVFGD